MGGMTRLLLLLWAGVTLTTALDLQKRIVGGKTCNDNERLYHVQLLDGNNNFICGGSLISDQWILTAEHCNIPNMKAVVRVHPGLSSDAGPGAAITAKELYPDDIYHDIMLLKLPEPVAGITPIPLPPNCNAKPTKGAKVQIAGHGYYSLYPDKTAVPDASDTLRCANINVVDCPDWLQTTHVKGSHQHWFCGQTTGKDARESDSGGGVVFNNMIYGVISINCGGDIACSEPVAFMDVCEYLGWIKTTTGIP